MGSCTRRHFLLSTCFLQMITIIERQVFDFLGYMWAPIFVNFFQILFVIFGFYGAYHFRIKYIITYLLWSFLWIGWNAFLICFYLDVGELDKNSDLLNLGTGSVSWFEVNGYGCKPTYPTNITSEDPFRPIRPERVDECLLDYTMVEVIHSGVQCALALFGILGAILISYIFLDEDDRFDFMNGDAKSPQHTVVHPMYVSYTSIPTSGSGTMLSNKHHTHSHNNHLNHHHQSHHQQPPNHHLTQNQTHNSHTNQSNKTDQQQHNYNNNTNTNPKNHSNTFLTHSNSNSNTPNASKNNTLNSSRKSYSAKSNKISSSTTTIIPTTALAAMKQKQKQHLQQYYDDSTAKADHQLYTNNSRQQHVLPTSNATAYQQQQQQNTNNNNNNNNNSNSNSSLSYASLQRFGGLQSNEFLSSNSNSNMAAGSLCSGAADVVGVALSNSNYSLANSISNTNSNNNNNGSGRFARIHAKPKPPKSSSYSSFIKGGAEGGGGGDGVGGGQHRPDIKYRQLGEQQQQQQLSHSLSNFEESFEDDLDEDLVALQDFKGGGYVPFQKPTPANLFVGGGGNNNNPSYASLNSNYSGNNNSNSAAVSHANNVRISPGNNSDGLSRISPNNNSIIHNNNNTSSGNISALGHPLTRDNSHLFLRNDNDLLLERSPAGPSSPPTPAASQALGLPPGLASRLPPFLSTANRALFQQNGLPFQPHLSLSPSANSNQRPARPSNIPLPTVPHHYLQHQHQHQQQYQPHQHQHQHQHHQHPPQFASPQSPLSPSAVTPPPPPAPRPHIFQPRSGHAPYPDLSPEVTEKYSMPTQYVPRSPIASRIARRQRQQQQQERSHLANTSANFCDQIRDAPPGYVDTGFNIVRAKSHDRLVAAASSSSMGRGKDSRDARDAAPHVNRRSGRAGGKARPRSYCNASAGGEGVIRHAPLLTDRAGDVPGAGTAYVA